MSGSLDAFISRYGSLIRQIVQRIGGRSVETIREDIEQTVVVNLWRQIAREQTIEHPASYVYRAAVRETVRAVRREVTRPGAGRYSTDPDEVAGAQNPHRQLESRELGDAIAACLASLAPARRRAVQAHLAGFQVDEIMELYGWSYQRARNLIARGMSELRRGLCERGLA